MSQSQPGGLRGAGWRPGDVPDQPLSALAQALAGAEPEGWRAYIDQERVSILTVRAPDGRLLRRMLRGVERSAQGAYAVESWAIGEMVGDLKAGAPSNAAPELFRVGGADCPLCGGQAVLIERSPDGVRRCEDGHEWRVRAGVAVAVDEGGQHPGEILLGGERRPDPDGGAPGGRPAEPPAG